MIMTSAVAISIQAVSPLSIRGIPPRHFTPEAPPDLSRRVGTGGGRVVRAGGPTRCRFGASSAAWGAPGCGSASGHPRGALLLIVPPHVDVAHGLVADRLVNVVRGRVGEVREQEAET